MRTGIGKIASAFEDDGNFHHAFYFKPSISGPTGASTIVDCSMSSGIPKFNAYAGNPLASTPLVGIGNNGIFTGTIGEDGQSSKRLLTARLRVANGSGAVNTAGSTFCICDYVLFYPLIDLDNAEDQEFDNTSSLPRFFDGSGLQMFMVCTVPSSLTTNATIYYTDSLDNELTTVATLTPGNAGQVISGIGSTSSFFIPLASKNGVKRVNRIKLNSSVGGFAALVICKPVATVVAHEQVVDSEITFINDKLTLPKIEQGAYLNLLSSVSASGGIQVYGEFLIVGVGN